MVKKTDQKPASASDDMALAKSVRVLILESPYYREVLDHLLAGATAVLVENGCTYDRFAVPGALELPQALAAAADCALIAEPGKTRYAGVIILGCVIRGETSHYDIVCGNANHWTYEIAIRHGIPLGNGLLTVDTMAQAMTRATGTDGGKGADAARACLRLIWLKANLATHATVRWE